MSNISLPNATGSSPPPAVPGSLWERVSLKQIALGTSLVALVVIGLALLVMLRYVFLMLFLGIVLATALAPLVERLRRWGAPQGAAVLIAFAALLLVVGGVLVALAPFFFGQIVQAVRDFPRFYTGFRTSLGQSDSRLLHAIGIYLPADLVGSLSGGSDTLSAQLTTLIPSVGQTLLAGALVLLLSYYWLYSRTLALQSVALLLPLDLRAGAIALWNEIEEKIGSFVRGLAILSLVIGVLSAVGYVAIGLPYGLTIAVIAGLLEAVPYVGPVITLILAGIVGLTVSQNMALLAIGIAMVIQLLENAIVVPRVMDKAVGVSPVVTLLALAVFSDLFGLLGALLAIPLAAGFQVLINHALRRVSTLSDPQIGGRDKLALLRYQTQDLTNDIRLQLRNKADEPDAEVDALEEQLESLLVDLDSYLATVQEQR